MTFNAAVPPVATTGIPSHLHQYLSVLYLGVDAVPLGLVQERRGAEPEGLSPAPLPGLRGYRRALAVRGGRRRADGEHGVGVVGVRAGTRWRAGPRRQRGLQGLGWGTKGNGRV